MLWILAAVLVVVWLGGWFLSIIGDAIHLVLVVAVALVIFNFVRARMGRVA